MQIRIDLKILVVALIFLITRQLELYLVFMFFAIVHEFGHLLTGLVLGFKPKKIEVLPTGVCVNFYIDLSNYNEKIKNANILVIKKIIITIAGPLTNFIFAVFFMMINTSLIGISKEILIYSNIIIGAFNIIPIYPLDGGRLVKYLVHIKSGLKNSYKCTNCVSNASIIILTMISSLAILWSKNIAIIFVITYLWGIVIIQNKRYRAKMQIYKMVEKIEDSI